MKTIYIDPETFVCHMEQDETGGRLKRRTDVFDGMSDQDIMGYRLVPEGYKWTDPDSGESYSGQHVMPVNYAMGGVIREFRRDLKGVEGQTAANAQAAEQNAADIVYISMMTGVEL